MDTRLLKVLAAFLLAACARAETGASGSWRHPAVAAIAYSGDSTLHAFQGTATPDAFELVLETPGDGAPGTWSAVVRVPLAGLTTGHKRRDANMQAMFESGHYPVIEGRVSRAPVPTGPVQSIPLVLTIHGVSHPIEAELRDWRGTPEGVTFRLAFPVSLAMFGLRPPSVLGVVRVADAVAVACEVRATPAAAGVGL